MFEATKHIGVVIVEDEALIRMLAVEAFEDAGFEVFEAASADEALTVLNNSADKAHVLFTDVHMPGTMDGLMLARHAGKNWPWITVIVASGRARPLTDELPSGSHFFQKPYDLSSVVGHIRKVA